MGRVGGRLDEWLEGLAHRLPPIGLKPDVNARKAHIYRSELAFALSRFAEDTSTGWNHVLTTRNYAKAHMFYLGNDQSSFTAFDLNRKIIASTRIET
jgi:hypothetical protein